MFSGRSKKHKGTLEEQQFALIDQILEMRKAARERANPTQNLANRATEDLTEHYKRNFSDSVPRYPFVTVTNHDGVRMYVRCHSEAFMREEGKKFSCKGCFSGVMGTTFKDIWKKAAELVCMYTVMYFD